MDCKDYRERIAERRAGELPRVEANDFDAHVEACAACKAALRDWEEMETLLRANWPSEDVHLPRLPLPAPVSRPWLDVAQTWFARASMAVVAGCLAVMVLYRPTIHLSRNGLSVSVGQVQPATNSFTPVDEAQIRSWVQATVDEAVAQESARLQAAAARDHGSSSEDTRRWGELSVHLQTIEQAQAYLWRQLEQQGLYLQTAWRSSAGSAGPSGKLSSNHE